MKKKGKGMENLTLEQIENWRKVLVGQIGPCALILPSETIETMRRRMQEHVNQMEETSGQDT